MSMTQHDGHDYDDRLYTVDERTAWVRWRDDTPEVIVCILFVVACIAVCIATSAGPVSLGLGQ